MTPEGVTLVLSWFAEHDHFFLARPDGRHRIFKKISDLVAGVRRKVGVDIYGNADARMSELRLHFFLMHSGHDEPAGVIMTKFMKRDSRQSDFAGNFGESAGYYACRLGWRRPTAGFTLRESRPLRLPARPGNRSAPKTAFSPASPVFRSQSSALIFFVWHDGVGGRHCSRVNVFYGGVC